MRNQLPDLAAQPEHATGDLGNIRIGEEQMATVRIPAPLRPYAGGNKDIAVAGETVGVALENLAESYPELRDHLFEGNRLRSFVNLYLNQEDIRYLNGPETELCESDTLMIIPSIAGGWEDE